MNNLFHSGLLSRSSLYVRLKEEENEIEKHKWYESEKAGKDVGWDWAMIDWIFRHKSRWYSSTYASGSHLPDENH